MIARGQGKIINICSVQTDLARPTISAVHRGQGRPAQPDPRHDRRMGGLGLQINGIAPGYIHTEMTQNLVDDAALQLLDPGPHPGQPLGHRAGPRRPAVWLASDGSNYVNGQTIFIDGGMTVVV